MCAGEDVHDFAAAAGYTTAATGPGGADGTVDVGFIRDEDVAITDLHPLPVHVGQSSRALVGCPAQPQHTSAFVASLRTHLDGRLPDHLLPATYAVLDHLPLGPDGRVDRAAFARRPDTDR